jgi:hypothetical protein
MRPGMVMAGILFLAASLPEPATAQRWTRPVRRIFDHYYGIEVGLIGGVNRTAVTGAGPFDARYRFAGGGFMSLPITTGLRFRPEVQVSGKQVGREGSFTPPALPCFPGQACPPAVEDVVHSFTWLEVPMLLEARFRGAFGGWGTPRIYAGPFVGLRLACSVITELTNTASPESEPKLLQSCADAEPGARYNNGDAGFVLGGGITAGSIGLGFRWTRSLVPVSPSDGNASVLAGAKNSTLSLTLEIATRLR